MPTIDDPRVDDPRIDDSGIRDSDFAIVIPARYRSSRFPGKPLAELAGRPMIQHVWERCAAAIDARHVFVATDDDRIQDACRGFGADVIMTSDTCLTGTDRVAEAAALLPHRFVVNVQGDEPMIDPSDVLAVAERFRDSGGAVVNAMAPIRSEEEYRSLNVPKVVAGPDGRLLYMSRAPIPSSKSGRFERAWRQVCIYAFSREQLERFASVPKKGTLEEIEDIEILRFLELGIDVSLVELAATTMAVDTPEDLEKVQGALSG